MDTYYCHYTHPASGKPQAFPFYAKANAESIARRFAGHVSLSNDPTAPALPGLDFRPAPDPGVTPEQIAAATAKKSRAPRKPRAKKASTTNA